MAESCRCLPCRNRMPYCKSFQIASQSAPALHKCRHPEAQEHKLLLAPVAVSHTNLFLVFIVRRLSAHEAFGLCAG